MIWRDPLLWAPDLVVGLGWLAFALVTWHRSRPTAVLGLAVCVSWFAADLTSAATMWHRAALAHLLLAAPGWWPRTRVGRVVLVMAYVLALLPWVWRSEPLNAGSLLALAGAVIWERGSAWSRRPGRRFRRAAMLCAVGLALVVAAGAVARSLVKNQDAVLPALLGYEVAMLCVAIALWSALRAHVGLRVADVVVELGTEPERALKAAMAQALDERQYEEGVRAAYRLQAAHDHLQETVAAQIADIAASRRRLLVAADEERARLRQRLESGAGARLDRIGKLLEEAAPSEHVKLACDRLRDTREDLEALAQGLRPRQLRAGLGPALEWLAAGTDPPVDVAAQVGRYPSDIETSAFFACAEAVTNALKHSGATRILLTARDGGSGLELTVSDDGGGGADPGGHGLTGVRDRVEALGGRLLIESVPGRGTTVRAVMGPA